MEQQKYILLQVIAQSQVSFKILVWEIETVSFFTDTERQTTTLFTQSIGTP